MPSTNANAVAARIVARNPNGTGQPSLSVVMAKAYPPTAMNPAWPKLSSPVKPKCTTRPMVARAYAAVVGEIASPSASQMKLKFMVPSLPSAHPLLPAQDALGPEEEDQDQHHQRRRVLQVLREHERREVHEHAQHDRADEGAECGAEAAERHGGEDQQQDRAAGVPSQRLVVGDQHAGE